MGDDKKADPLGFQSMAVAWSETMNAFWKNLSAMTGPAGQKNPQPPQEGENDAPFSAVNAMGKAMQNWQTMTTAMAAPESADALLKGAGAMPDLLAQLAQSAMGSFLEMQRKAVESAGRISTSVEAYRFENIDENLLHAWTDIYEKEFRQFFRMPQLGLNRTYQEKLNAALDAANRFQATFAEFLRLLTLPFNRALTVMQDQLGDMAEKGELPEDPRAYYRMWIKVLEGHFMTLFQTPEYVETLGKTVTVLTEFSAARDAVFEDMLRSVPVAGRSEMDDLAREVYELKKRIRKLEQS